MLFVLVFIHFTGDDLRYYQIGTSFPNKVECDKERLAASPLMTQTGTGLFCLEINRN